MHWDVVEVKAEAAHTLFVRFADGERGCVWLDPEELTGVLAPLRDREFFERVFVDHGAVAWPGGIELAPDAMYERVMRKPRLGSMRGEFSYVEGWDRPMTDEEVDDFLEGQY